MNKWFIFLEFYSKGGGYNSFAGKDCSVNLAKMDLSSKYFNKYNQIKLNNNEKSNL